MLRFGIFCLTKKGFILLDRFIRVIGSDAISFVVSAKDEKIKEDYFEQIRDLCLHNNIRFCKKEEFDIKNIKVPTYDYALAVSWKWIIRNVENLIVFHDSLLPKYRGFAPLPNMLINGERIIGVTAIKATEEYDKGNIVLQKSIEIEYPLKISKAIDMISQLYADMAIELYQKISNSELTEIPQDNNFATYSPWLDENDYFINWHWDSYKIKRFVDAVGYPYDGAKSYLNKQVIVRIEDVEIVEDVCIEDRERHIGKVIFMDKEGKPTVICGKGLVRITNMSDLNGRPISISFRSRFS